MHGDRFIFETDPDNGMLIGSDGCHYDSEAEAMYFGLGLCGCDCPDDVHKMFVESVKCMDSSNGWDARKGVDGIVELVRNDPDVAAEFIAHFLDHKELLEHGISVYGSWLTDKGKQFVEIGPHLE